MKRGKKMATYSYGFLRGFLTGKGSLPLSSDGDDRTLTLKKGDDFQDWLTDKTLLHGGEEMGAKNRATLHKLIDAWLDGVEFEG